MSTFLTADTHFGHPLMLTALNRPYSHVDEMDEAMISAWNAVVHPKDTVWHLGDFSMKHEQRRVSEIWHALNGRKHLIIGNHDVDKKGDLLPALSRLDWVSVSHFAEIKHDGQRIMLSHYAPYVWNQAHRGSYAAFGHSHGQVVGMPGTIDVGVDNQGLKPISVEEFIRQAEDSIINAQEVVNTISDRLIGLTDVWKERAKAIKQNRRRINEEEESSSSFRL
ncbi:metallophosphoesterase [Brucella tritici]|uniref:Metallophosphoesterase n=1 Tax=Brucella tritici TaxID=94626 RepID=A0A7V8B0S8_9HYPH|nr:metallophosphoesterase family protein [Brucella tritici]KAB2655089.1 metallophosphoesterase [Brucella tritici]